MHVSEPTTRTDRIGADALRDFVARLFEAAGMNETDAATVADVLVWANLRGVDSHGVLRVPNYLEYTRNGIMDAKAAPTIVRSLPAAALMDAARAAGPVAMTRAMDHAVMLARKAGIGMVTVRRTTHTGPVGYYALMAAKADMIGLVFSTSTPNMAYFGAREPGVSNAPVAIAVPTATHAPLVLDMASSVAASGKIKQALDSGLPIPADWALGKDGKPTTDPAAVDILLPLGGPKGSGLALMLECLTGLLSGAPALERMLAGKEPRKHRQNAMAIAVDVAAFTDPATFRADADALAAAVTALPRLSEADEILMPGERGARTEAERKRDGIPLPRGTWRRLGEAAAKFGVTVPEPI
jgi:ureidoglycolate dehydrogenase (NAD+)